MYRIQNKYDKHLHLVLAFLLCSEVEVYPTKDQQESAKSSHSTSLKISFQTYWCLDGTVPCAHPKLLLNFQGRSLGVNAENALRERHGLVRWKQFLDMSDIKSSVSLLPKKFCSHTFWNASQARLSFLLNKRGILENLISLRRGDLV